MIESFLQIIIGWVTALGFMGVFYGALLEELFYIIPSSIVQLSAGAILLGHISFSWALLGKAFLIIGLPAAVGVTIGSLPYYALGYFGGKPAIERWGKWFGVSWSDVEALDAQFIKNWWDEIIFIGLRALPVLPSVALSIGPGVLRMSLRSYITGSFIGTLIRGTGMGFLGGMFGGQFGSISSAISSAEKIGFVILGMTFLVTGYFWLRRRNNRNKQKSGITDTQ